jgi:hypothetical protein
MSVVKLGDLITLGCSGDWDARPIVLLTQELVDCVNKLLEAYNVQESMIHIINETAKTQNNPPASPI